MRPRAKKPLKKNLKLRRSAKLNQAPSNEVEHLFDAPAVYVNRTFITVTQDGLIFLGLSDETNSGLLHRGNFIMSQVNLRNIHNIFSQAIERMDNKK